MELVTAIYFDEFLFDTETTIQLLTFAYSHVNYFQKNNCHEPRLSALYTNKIISLTITELKLSYVHYVTLVRYYSMMMAR